MQKRSSNSSSFLGNALIYTIGSMITPAMGLILLPIYTLYLTPGEYGTITTIQALVSVLQLIMLLSLHGAITRLYYEFIEKPKEQAAYLGSIFLFVLLFSSALSIFLFVLKPLIGNLLLKSIPLDPFYFYFIILSFVTSLSSLFLSIIRVKERPWSFMIGYTLKGFLLLFISLLVIIKLHMGASGALLASIITEGAILLVYFFICKKDMTFSISKSYVWMSLVYSIPLLPHTLSNWFIVASDRVILEKFISLDQLGYYGLAAQMSTVLRMLYMSINSAYVPRYNLLQKQGKPVEKMNAYFLVIILVTGFLAIFCSGFLLRMLTSQSYYPAQRFLPFLLIGEMLEGVNYIIATKLLYFKKTGSVSSSSFIAAAINIVGNFALIPFIGVWGAVVSTLAAEFIRLSFNILWLKRIKRSSCITKGNPEKYGGST
ncbi:lipopolysaccharide biosynthesis protein [Ectobacillus polymachus]|uniref:lipopolysaccharide biosynthesis protein n=1 Tax=Ectobacillus polymachus TaxID=1508806 RepID=UPI003A8BCF78